MELLSGEKYQGFRARCKDVARCHAKRIGPIKARSLRKRAGTDQIGSRTQGGCGEIKFSQARSVRRRCDHVPNCHRHRCNFRAYKETPVLVCQFAVRGSWMRICGTRRDRKLTGLPKTLVSAVRCLRKTRGCRNGMSPNTKPLRSVAIPKRKACYSFTHPLDGATKTGKVLAPLGFRMRTFRT